MLLFAGAGQRSAACRMYIVRYALGAFTPSAVGSRLSEAEWGSALPDASTGRTSLRTLLWLALLVRQQQETALQNDRKEADICRALGKQFR